MDGAEPGYWLGTDSLGRDVLIRILYGARIALLVALVAGTITCLPSGPTLGLLAGFLRGWVDVVISRLIDIWMAFPPVLFSILLIAVIGPGLSSIIIAIVVIDWTRFARVIRAEAMAQGAMDYVASAAGGRAAAGMGTMVTRDPAQRAAHHRRAADAGDGHRRDRRGDPVLREPLDLHRRPDLGRHDRRGAHQSIYQAWWVLVFPLIALFLTVLTFSQLGEGLKDRFDPVLR